MADGKITGTLKYVDSGTLATDWGAGNFIALKFTPADGVDRVEVGLNPSAGSGLVDLDEDLNGVFKITNKNTQKFVVVNHKGKHSYTQVFDLSELVCQTGE